VVANAVSRHAVHLILFAVPVGAVCVAVAWQELRARIAAARSTAAPSARETTPARRSEWCWIGAAGLVVAGAIHAAVAPEHFEESLAFGVFFALLTAAQWLTAAAWLHRPTPAVVRTIGLGSAAVVVLWIVSRTTGLPAGPTPWQPERLGQADLLSTGFELLTCVACFVDARAIGASKALRPSYEGAV
jgi:hypothetical protein